MQEAWPWQYAGSLEQAAYRNLGTGSMQRAQEASRQIIPSSMQATISVHHAGSFIIRPLLNGTNKPFLISMYLSRFITKILILKVPCNVIHLHYTVRVVLVRNGTKHLLFMSLYHNTYFLSLQAP
jgi:hypothetical protein